MYKSSHKSDANLRYHLGNGHGMNDYLFPSQLKDKNKDDGEEAIVTPERRRELHRAIFEAIIRDGRPFNDFSRPGMLHFLATAIPNYRPPHRTTIRRYLLAKYVEHRKILRSILSGIGSIALTADLWRSGRRTTFLCVTAHCFNKEYECVPLVIGFRSFSGRHLAQRIRLYIEYELDSLGIDKNCIVAITTDNGADVRSATIDGFGQRVSCLAHNLHLTINKGLSLWAKPDPSK